MKYDPLNLNNCKLILTILTLYFANYNFHRVNSWYSAYN